MQLLAVTVVCFIYIYVYVIQLCFDFKRLLYNFVIRVLQFSAHKQYICGIEKRLRKCILKQQRMKTREAVSVSDRCVNIYCYKRACHGVTESRFTHELQMLLKSFCTFFCWPVLSMGRLEYLWRCVILGFRCDVDENCACLCYFAAGTGNFLPTFRDNLQVPSSRVKNLAPEDVTVRLSRNVVKKLLLLAAYYL